MNLSPKVKLNIVFWLITIPVVPFVLLLLLVGLVFSPIPKIGEHILNSIEKVITKFAIWRNNLPVVKNAYDKAHLFDYIKG
jgi:hypothetical protein